MKGGDDMEKKGLSTVITSLIIILLVLVAIGIVWVTVRGIIDRGTGQVDIKSKCLEVDVRPTALGSCNATYCIATLNRKAGGVDVAGVKLIVSNTAAGTSNITSYPNNIVPLATLNILAGANTVVSPNKVEVVVYFKDAAGVDTLCDQKTSFSP
jgi:hypothetical protein